MRLSLPQSPLPMLKLNGPWIVCSHYLYCRPCGERIEGIGSTPEQAERRAIDLFSKHAQAYHVSLGRH